MNDREEEAIIFAAVAQLFAEQAKILLRDKARLKEIEEAWNNAVREAEKRIQQREAEQRETDSLLGRLERSDADKEQIPSRSDLEKGAKSTLRSDQIERFNALLTAAFRGVQLEVEDEKRIQSRGNENRDAERDRGNERTNHAATREKTRRRKGYEAPERDDDMDRGHGRGGLGR